MFCPEVVCLPPRCRYLKVYQYSQLSKSSGTTGHSDSWSNSGLGPAGVYLSRCLCLIMPHVLSTTWEKFISEHATRSKSLQRTPTLAPCTPERKSKAHPDPIILSTPHLTNTLPVESFTDSSMGNCTWHNLLSSPSTNSDTFTVGIGACKPKTGNLALHRHEQAEVYYVLSGNGVVRIEGKNYSVTAGDLVFIPGNAEHGVYNYESEEFRFLYCFGVRSFQEIVYRFTKEEEAASGEGMVGQGLS